MKLKSIIGSLGNSIFLLILIGQVALADVCGLGADVIVTKNVARANA